MVEFIPCQNCSQPINRLLDVCPYCGSDPGGDQGNLSSDPAEPPSEIVFPGRYRPIRTVAVFLQLLFGLLVLGSAVAITTGWSYRTVLLDLDAGRSVSMDDAILAEDSYLAAGGILILANIVLALVFVVWFWRAYSNLTALGRTRKRRAGWAIGAWLIPFANYVIPYGIGAEIWKQSEPDSVGYPTQDRPNMEPVISWWALFVLMGLVNQIAFFNSAELADDPGRVAAIVGIDLVSRFLGIAGAVAAVRFVRLSTDKQDALAQSVISSP